MIKIAISNDVDPASRILLPPATREYSYPSNSVRNSILIDSLRVLLPDNNYPSFSDELNY